jgi:hypothetical protein
MKQKLKLGAIVGGILCLFAFGIVDPAQVLAWARYAQVTILGKVPRGSRPTGDFAKAHVCRENLHRIQTAKRKAGQERGNPVGQVAWDEVLVTMHGAHVRSVSTDDRNALMPNCPEGGTYSLGTLEEVPRCSISGNGTNTVQDDHIIRD